MAVAGETHEHEHMCSARRRRDRRLRAWWRHEQFAIRCAVASATHHSAYRSRRLDAETQTIAPAPDDPAVYPVSTPPTPVDENVAPPPDAAPGPVAEYVVSPLEVTYAALTPVDEYVAPPPEVTYAGDAAPGPVAEYFDPAPAVDPTPAVPVVDAPPEGTERTQPAASCAAPVPGAKKRRRGKVPAANCAAPAVAAPAASEMETAIQEVSDLLASGLGEGSPEFDAASARLIELGMAPLEEAVNRHAEALLLEEEQEARQMAKKQAKRKKR